MSGSIDDKRVELVNMDEMALIVLCDADGNVRMRGKGDNAWKAQVLRTIVDKLEANPEGTKEI